MANREQLRILKQGVKIWNKWRKENPDLQIDLSGAELFKEDLAGANLRISNLRDANLRAANLAKANLRGTNLNRADLFEANLNGANLIEAGFFKAYLQGTHLIGANLSRAGLLNARLLGAELTEANLRGADLGEANLISANLHAANLREANLSFADLRAADLTGSNFFKAKVNSTIFGSDLRDALGLEAVIHSGPSSISTHTFVLSKGKIPEVFLRGCGLSDWEIEEAKLYNPDLSNEEVSKILYKIYDLRATQALQISPLFISYSHGDGSFVDKIEKHLNNQGVRFWRDIHDMKSGRMERQIDMAIRQNPTVLLVLSEHSLASDWVEHEVRTARGLEKETGRDVLCPVALDDSWKDSRWPKRIMEQIMEYNVLDFSAWKDDVKFEGMFRKLIDGLELFYKG